MTLVVLALSLAVALGSDDPFRRLTLEQSLATAKREHKVVMIDFFTTWCVPCKRLDEVTWTDPKVRSWLTDRTIAIKIDAEGEPEIASRFEVHVYPTILFLNEDGKQIDRLVGFRAPDKFLEASADALTGRTSEARANEELVGRQNDPTARAKHGSELERAGKYEEALADYLWCFDHGLEAKPSYAAVRCSFLLSDIVRLGKVYPPALEAIRERRDLTESKVISGKGSREDARDLACIDRELLMPEKTLAIFDRLKQQQLLSADVGRALVVEIAEPLVRAKRWNDVFEHGHDLEALVQREIESQKNRVGQSKTIESEGASAKTSPEAGMRLLTTNRVGLWFETLLGTGRRESAEALAKNLLGVLPLGSVYASLIDHAIHADATDVARSLADQALATLKGPERATAEEAAKRIPARK